MFDIDYKILSFLLAKQNEGDAILEQFKIQFPSKRISHDSNSIFIGLAESTATNKTHESQYYNNLVDIIITTKNKEYVKASKIFRAVSKRVISLLRQSKEFSDSFNVVSYIPKYDESTLVLKQADLLLSFESLEEFNITDEEIKNILIGDVTIEVEGEVECQEKEKNQL